MLSKLLPTGDNIVEIILKTSNTKHLAKYLANGTIICDGTHVSTDTLGDSEQQKIQYADGKGQHTFNTLVMINGDGIILYISSTYAGSIDDLPYSKKKRHQRYGRTSQEKIGKKHTKNTCMQ